MTSIEWTRGDDGKPGKTWNPVRGCSRVSPGCVNCYAETMAARNLPEMRSPTTGKPFAVRTAGGPRWTGKVELIPSKLDEPLRWRKPRRVFVNSMSDLFHESLDFHDIAAVYGVMAMAPQHTFQVLTKRPERRLAFMLWMCELVGPKDAHGNPPFANMATDPVAGALMAAGHRGVRDWPRKLGDAWPPWPLPNVWEGTSVEDQTTADERIPLLLQTPAAVRFVSYEPALAGVDFEPWVRGSKRVHVSADVAGAIRNRSFSGLAADDGRPLSRAEAEAELRALLARGVKLIPGAGCNDFDPERGCRGHRNPRLDWVIVGGESGPGARPFDSAWARSTVAQCKAAGVPVFVKQMGRWIVGDHAGFRVDRWLVGRGRRIYVPPILGEAASARPPDAVAFTLGGKGGRLAYWPEDLRVREFPRTEATG